MNAHGQNGFPGHAPTVSEQLQEVREELELAKAKAELVALRASQFSGHPAKCPGGQEGQGPEHDPDHPDNAAVPRGLRDKAKAAAGKAKAAAGAVGSWLDQHTDVPVVKQVKGVVGGVLGKLKDAQVKLMGVMEKRYGKKVAKAIFVVGVRLFGSRMPEGRMSVAVGHFG